MSTEPPRKIMLASRLIAELQTAVQTYGDMQVVLIDPDTSWYMDIELSAPTAKAHLISGSGYGDGVIENNEIEEAE